MEYHKIWLLLREPPSYSYRGEITDVVVMDEGGSDIRTVECTSQQYFRPPALGCMLLSKAHSRVTE